jgi:hypothetical protein
MTGIVKAFVAGTLGLAGLLVAAGYAYPLDTQKSCNAAGYILCGDGHCGTKTCGGKQPGETMCSHVACYMCDGCSGTWILVGRSQQPGRTGLAVQLPGVEIPPGTPSQPGSSLPRPPVSSAPATER